MFQVLFYIVILCYCTQSLELPAYIDRCSRSSPTLDQCILISSAKIIPHLVEGIDNFDIPNMLPLKLKEVPIRNDQSLRFILRNVEVYGLETTRLTYSKMDFDNTEYICTLINPKIDILGHYEMNGVIAESYVYGRGNVNISLINGQYFQNTKFDIDDNDFARNISVRLSYTTAYNRYYFSGLTVAYDSDEFRTNEFMNHNWKEVSRSFQPGANIEMGNFIGSIFQKFDDRLPLTTTFLP